MLLKNLVAAAALASAAFAAPADKRQNRKLKWFGINESGAEFGEKNFTGVYGKEYIWYDLKTIDVSSLHSSPTHRHNQKSSIYQRPNSY